MMIIDHEFFSFRITGPVRETWYPVVPDEIPRRRSGFRRCLVEHAGQKTVCGGVKTAKVGL